MSSSTYHFPELKTELFPDNASLLIVTEAVTTSDSKSELPVLPRCRCIIINNVQTRFKDEI